MSSMEIRIENHMPICYNQTMQTKGMTGVALFGNNRTGGLFRSRKWNRGNDIYGVRGKEFISPDDAEGKLDHLDKSKGFTRSLFYHAYWRGWTEVRVNRLGSKPYQIERVYTAPWIRQGLSDRNYVLVRFLYGLLLALSAVLFAFAMTRRVGSNYCWYVALFGMPATILMIVTLWVFVIYAKAPRKMTLWEHRVSSIYLWRAAVVFSALLAATAIATGVYAALNPADQPLRQLINAGLDLLAAAGAFAVFRTEKRMKYEDIPNTNKAPAGGQEIR